MTMNHICHLDVHEKVGFEKARRKNKLFYTPNDSMKNKMKNNKTGKSKGMRWVFKCNIKLQCLLSFTDKIYTSPQNPIQHS